MVFNLSFEFDTIDAIKEARSTLALFMAIFIRVAPFIVYCICAAFEYVAYNAVDSRLPVSCIKHFEISDPAFVYLLTTYTIFLPDFVFAILGPLSIFMVYNNPYGVCYNALAGIACFAGGGYFHANMTFCANPEQDSMIIGPILLYISGILHLGHAVLNHSSFRYLDKQGEAYFGQTLDLIEDSFKNK